jgi:pimeloyl-ACP methyl ester carboxylesterase
MTQQATSTEILTPPDTCRHWVLLRGLTRERRHWEQFPDVLRNHFPNDCFYFHDYAGNGHRYREKSATSITETMEDTRQGVIEMFSDMHDIDDLHKMPVYIIALSLGGMVAIDWLTRYPEECRAAVLISTSFRGLNPFYQRLLPSNYPMIIHSLFSRRSSRANELDNLKLVSNMAASDPARRELILDHWVQYARDCPVSGVNGLRQLLAAIRFHLPEKNALCKPALVVRSIADHMVSPECSKRFAEAWGLPMVTHPSAGHDISLDDPEWVAGQIAHWLAQNDL